MRRALALTLLCTVMMMGSEAADGEEHLQAWGHTAAACTSAPFTAPSLAHSFALRSLASRTTLGRFDGWRMFWQPCGVNNAERGGWGLAVSALTPTKCVYATSAQPG